MGGDKTEYASSSSSSPPPPSSAPVRVILRVRVVKYGGDESHKSRARQNENISLNVNNERLKKLLPGPALPSPSFLAGGGKTRGQCSHVPPAN